MVKFRLIQRDGKGGDFLEKKGNNYRIVYIKGKNKSPAYMVTNFLSEKSMDSYLIGRYGKTISEIID